MSDSSVRAFAHWIQDQNWHEISRLGSCQLKADVFYEMVNQSIDLYFPTRIAKKHCSDLNNCFMLEGFAG